MLISVLEAKATISNRYLVAFITRSTQKAQRAVNEARETFMSADLHAYTFTLGLPTAPHLWPPPQ